MSTDERLYLKDLGPIREADIALRDLTVFVGPQAAGKSLASQLLYFMRGMEELLAPDSYAAGAILAGNLARAHDRFESVINAWSFWTGLNPLSLAHRETIVRWTPANQASGQEIHLRAHPTSAQPGGEGELGKTLRDRVEEALRGALSPVGAEPERQVYIPAGRILQSFVTPSQALYMLGRMGVQWPGYTNLFYDKLGGALKRLFENTRAHGFQPLASDPVLDRMEATLQGKLLFDDPERIHLFVEDLIAKEESYSSSFAFDPLKLASGQMELWPFWTIVLDGLLGDRPSAIRIFCEEPEAHVHPSAQRGLMEAVATLIQRRQRFVITTHSPYIIYAINNFLMADKVSSSGCPLPSAAAATPTLSPAQVSAYRFVRGGRVESILDEETGLLKTEELDDPAAELNAVFSHLQDALE